MRKRRGDPLVDTLFEIIIGALKNKSLIAGVRKVTSLRDPDRKNTFLCGLMDYPDYWGHAYIYISADNRKNPTQKHLAITLLHEVLHAVLPRVEENYILDLELLWHRFSKRQRTILKSYIPERFSRKRPY